MAVLDPLDRTAIPVEYNHEEFTTLRRRTGIDGFAQEASGELLQLSVLGLALQRRSTAEMDTRHPCTHLGAQGDLPALVNCRLVFLFHVEVAQC